MFCGCLHAVQPALIATVPEVYPYPSHLLNLASNQSGTNSPLDDVIEAIGVSPICLSHRLLPTEQPPVGSGKIRQFTPLSGTEQGFHDNESPWANQMYRHT
ncbi:hypothetical protein T265_01297 [Opisthorchis viverrini]|uniref:Uncharacterized protein n=1 Tax=Opisthorchis viverrini TaxID=6198 RepID=A0A074ZYS5_OPIVI|nr:hypothetical protein T265_01297 [Opisthorchis viverrini]KER32608.1 hypothetical protein T265_01297 [Opisthorchis viverrini]